MDLVYVSQVVVEDRLRKEMGDIDKLASSIKEFGLIQPIVLTLAIEPIDGLLKEFIKLVAGGRRFEALKRLNWTTLEHGRDFIWRDETLFPSSEEKALRLKSVELEENLRRQGLTWQEEIAGKQKLLELMQSIYGPPTLGAPTRSQRLSGEGTGFGVNKLSAMLGESAAQTSNDLALANIISKIPHLAKADTKESARRQYLIIGAVAGMTHSAKTPIAGAGASSWILHEGDFHANISKVPDKSVDLVYTDLPFGVSLSKMSKHNTGAVGYSDDRDSVVSMLGDIASESLRVLADDRFAVFFFGFNYYQELCESFRNAGFAINPVPFIWYKHSNSTENPNVRYANAYDQALVVMKGSPLFIRPGQPNLVDIPVVKPSQKLQVAQQPVQLVTRFIEDMTSVGATVLDFCAGSGTTGEAALRAKRRVVLFEREVAACAIIKARLGAI